MRLGCANLTCARIDSSSYCKTKSVTIVTTIKTSGKTITPSFASFDSLSHDYSESNSFVHTPAFDLGGGIFLKANQKSLLREALPFGVYYDKPVAGKPLREGILTRTLSPSVLNGLTNDGFTNPRYTAAIDPQFSCFTLNCSPSCSTVVGDAENTFNAPNYTGFQLKSSCLVFIDRNGLVYPVTFHLVMLLIALSIHVPKSIRAMAVSTFDEVTPMDMPLRLQNTYHPARICWLHNPNFFDEFGIDMSQYVSYYGTCATGFDFESLSENKSSFPSFWDRNATSFAWTGPSPKSKLPDDTLGYEPQSASTKVFTSAVSSFSHFATTLADYFEIGDDTRYLFSLLYDAYPTGRLGALLTTTIVAFIYHCIQVFINIFSFLSFGLGTAFGYIFLNKPIHHTSFFSPMAVRQSRSERKARVKQYAPQSGEVDNPDVEATDGEEPSSSTGGLSTTSTPSANSMKQVGGVSIPADANYWCKEHTSSNVSAFHTRSSALPCANFGSSSRSFNTIAGESLSPKVSDKDNRSEKSISSQTTVPTSNTHKLNGFGV